MRLYQEELFARTAWPVKVQVVKLRFTVKGKTEGKKDIWPPGKAIPPLFFKGHQDQRRYGAHPTSDA
jgi:hypothetical protein